MSPLGATIEWEHAVKFDEELGDFVWANPHQKDTAPDEVNDFIVCCILLFCVKKKAKPHGRLISDFSMKSIRTTDSHGPNFRIPEDLCGMKWLIQIRRIVFEYAALCAKHPNVDIYTWTSDAKSFFMQYLIAMACRSQMGVVRPVHVQPPITFYRQHVGVREGCPLPDAIPQR